MPRRTGGFIGHRGLQAPDPPTAVTPTAGNAQVSVAFTAPSDVGDDAITGFNVQSNNADGQMLIGISSATYDNVEFSVNSLDSVPTDVAFNSDGTKMYVLGIVSDKVHQFTLSTAFDLSTASSDSVNFSVGSQDINPYGIAFNNNGTKMYMCGNTSDSIHQYTLSTGFDLSTASYDSVSLNVSSQESIPAGVQFNNDGTKMYMTGNSNSVYQYTLSTAFDLSTASYDSVSLDVSSLENVTSALAFNNDGTKLYITGHGNETIFQHTLSTAFDLSTASYDNLSLDVSSIEGNPRGLAFNNDDTKMYVIGPSTDKVHQFTTNFNSYPSASPIVISGLTNGTSYTVKAFAINDYGTSAPSEASASFSPVFPARGVFAGGLNVSPTAYLNTLQFVTITSTGNTQDFGDLTQGVYRLMGLSSSTRGVRGGGRDASENQNTMDYVTINTEGNASDFGDLSDVSTIGSGTSNETRGLFHLGVDTNDYTNTTEYITIASTGNTTDFGDRTIAAAFSEGAVASTTRAVFGTGYGNSDYQNVIDYFTIASTGNATDFGDATVARYGCGAGNSSTRGIWVGGVNGSGNSNVADYITIASAGNATDFGDLSTARYVGAGLSNLTRILYGGGNTGSNNFKDEISYFTISSTGNDTDFGNLAAATANLTAFSNSHGGLS